MDWKSDVYLLRNTVNNKSYVGSSLDIGRRWKQHRRDLDNNTHANIYLQRSWNKYGPDAFEFTVVEHTDSLLCREQYWLDIFAGEGCGVYNVAIVVASPNIGRKASKETLAKMSAAQLGKVRSKSMRSKLRAANSGKTLSEDHKRKIGERAKTRVISEETRRKMYAARRSNKLQKTLDSIISKWRKTDESRFS